MTDQQQVRESPGSQAAPCDWRAAADLERWIAVVRLGAGAFLVVQLILLPPTLRQLPLAGLFLLLAAAGLVFALRAVAPGALARDTLRIPLFLSDWAAATIVLAAYDSPGDLTWIVFLFVIMEGGVRWQLRGALTGFLLFAAADLPFEILTPAYTRLHFDPASISFRLGLLGVAALFFGLQNRHSRRLAEALERQTQRLEQDYQAQASGAARLRDSEAALRASETRLRSSEAALRVIVDSSLNAIVTMDEVGFVTGWNPEAAHLFGWTREEALGRPVHETLFAPEARVEHGREIERLLHSREARAAGQVLELRGMHRDGRQFPIELAISPGSRQGERLTFVAFIRDISERKRAERLKTAQFAATRALAEAPTILAAAPALLRGLCENLGWDVGQLWLVDAEAGLLRWYSGWHLPAAEAVAFLEASRQAAFALGEGLPGRVWASARESWSADGGGDGRLAELARAGRGELRGAVAFPVRTGFNVTGVIELHARRIAEPDHETLQVLTDIGLQLGQFVERKRVEDELTKALQYQALHDPLTGLPNRTLFTDRLTQALLQHHRDSRRMALLMLDLDGFKEVNDRLGHHAGDLLLRDVSTRLREALRESDTVARLGGDEFAVLPAGTDGIAAAARTAEKLMGALRRPFQVDGRLVEVRASVGIAMCPEDGADADSLLRAADAAMYSAKRSGSGYATSAVEPPPRLRRVAGAEAGEALRPSSEGLAG
ncbi:MAG TPA: diguanylate cyclase [Candidatus Dormibacteraeota bacterium]|jgi:diguanylate cyclase (GGDEF)-like protein/PAS domain S-box-containing protein|nr:diguanylate cyclase [Candidatus Dormibacteraeota bacterium]